MQKVLTLHLIGSSPITIFWKKRRYVFFLYAKSVGNFIHMSKRWRNGLHAYAWGCYSHICSSRYSYHLRIKTWHYSSTLHSIVTALLATVVHNILLRMKKFLYSIVFVLGFIAAQAQSTNSVSQDSQEVTQILVHRVDSLEHELSYLKLTYELDRLNSDITMFANEVYTKSIAIQLDLYNRNFNSKLGNSYQQYYESCLRKKQTISGLIEAQKRFFTLKVITYPYSERELDTLMARCNVIDDAYDILEHSMNLFKITFDVYKEQM